MLKAGAALGASTLLGDPVLRALAGPPTPGTLADIENVVIFIQENRSFDHYFGTLPGVRGFDDPGALPGVFAQSFAAAGKTLTVTPYHLDTTGGGSNTGECTNDITHSYGDQHACWNGGAMDRWAAVHQHDSEQSFMGYYTRRDLGYYYAVADAFTVCDAYHCSVMGSTTSNRLYSLTAMLDPDGKYGGPILSTQQLVDDLPNGKFSDGWLTYPEKLTDAGVSWKCYSSVDGDDEDNPLYLFKQYYPQNYPPGSAMGVRAAQLQSSLEAMFPAQFLADAAAGTLPQVSWIVANIVQSEHPAGAPQDGENVLSQVVTALVASPLWPSTVLFHTYDENGGFFDHVAPPTPPPGTAGEFVKGDPTTPIGLGFRVPMLIVSPFSRGGFVARDVFDHTSLLRFLETRFGVEVPNLTAWRRQVVGDMTSALNFAVPDASMPLGVLSTPAPPDDPAQHPECATEEFQPSQYPIPASPPAPHQEPGSRPSPSGRMGPPAQAPELPRGLGAVAVAGGLAAAWWNRRRATGATGEDVVATPGSNLEAPAQEISSP